MKKDWDVRYACKKIEYEFVLNIYVVLILENKFPSLFHESLIVLYDYMKIFIFLSYSLIFSMCEAVKK